MSKEVCASVLSGGIVFRKSNLGGVPVVSLIGVRENMGGMDYLVLSGAYSVSLSGSHVFPTSVVCTPVVGLAACVSILRGRNIGDDGVRGRVSSLGRRGVARVVFLPTGSRVRSSVIFLSGVCRISGHFVGQSALRSRHLFSLDSCNFCVLVFGLSVRFSHVRRGIGENYVTGWLM